MLREKININSASGSSLNIEVPLSSSFSLDLKKESAVTDHFNRLKDELIPAIVDMEKVVLYPAVFNKSGQLKEASEIDINFHFRKRIPDGFKTMSSGWTTNDSFDWNGRYYDPASTNNDTREYEGDKPERGRSDLIGFLGFTNDDIKYQRNRVKQSFLRMMYYDSDDIINKNLLTYSTSFLDAGKLYSNFSLMRNNKDFIEYPDGQNKLVDNEATKFSFTCFEPREVDEKYDELRLSSGIVLKSKEDTSASSDGFYLYLFKSDAPDGKTAKDLFLRAEFNNAGYGKTIAFTMPNKRPDGELITPEWRDNYVQNVFFDGTSEIGEKFNYDLWHNDTYLPVKCVYDEERQRYYYYFPWNEEVNRFDEGRIVLDLYEPKLNRTPNSPVAMFDFTPSGETVSADRGYVVATLKVSNATVLSLRKGGDNFTYVEQGRDTDVSDPNITNIRYKLSFSPNTDGNYETATKYYRLEASGESGSTSGACSSSFYVTHQGDTCTPSVTWAFPKKVVEAEATNVTLNFTAYCVGSGQDPEVSSSNSHFSVSSVNSGGVTLVFSQNTSTAGPETSTITVTVRNAGRSASASMELEQIASGGCSPSVTWSEKDVTVTATSSSRQLTYDCFCVDEEISPVLQTTNDHFHLALSSSYHTIDVTFAQNDSTTQDETATFTITVEHDGHTASDTMSFKQAASTIKPGEITITGPNTVPLTGGSIVFTASTKYLENIRAEITGSIASGDYELSVSQGTSALDNGNGTSTITVNVHSMENGGSETGSGYELSVTKDGYQQKVIKVSCENRETCLSKSERSFTITANGTGQDGSHTSNSITITQS